jgi:hypothetical protein
VECQAIEFNKLALDSALVGRTAADMAAAAATDADAPAMSASDRFLRDSVGLLAGLRFTDAPDKQFLVGSAHLFWYDYKCKSCRRPSGNILTAYVCGPNGMYVASWAFHQGPCLCRR